MNLDLFPLGWVHLVASLAALAGGILVVLRPRRAALAGSDLRRFSTRPETKYVT